MKGKRKVKMKRKKEEEEEEEEKEKEKEEEKEKEDEEADQGSGGWRGSPLKAIKPWSHTGKQTKILHKIRYQRLSYSIE